MKRLLLITGLCLHTALHASAAARDEAPLTLGKKGRVLVRMPSQAIPNNPESNTITKPKPIGEIRVITVGGTGWPKRIDGPRGVSAFRDPFEVAIDANGDAIISEHWNHDVRKISGRTYVASTVASGIRNATGLDIDRLGNIYVSRYYGPGCRGGDIMRLAPSGQRKIIQKGFFRPTSVCVDEKGTLWVADTPKSKIIRIQPDGTRKIWDGVHASHIALGPDGNLYFADYGKSCVRRITRSGTVEIVAGTPGQLGHRDGTASQALFQGLYGIAVSPRGTIFVTDGHAIRKISPEGMVSTVAGHPDESGNIDGTASEARFFKPCGLAFDRNGDLWVTCRAGYVRLVLDAESGNPIKITPPKDQSTVDLMIVYNPRLYRLYKDAAGIQMKAAFAVQQINTALKVSQTGARVRLVAVESIQYKTAGNIGADLHRIRVDKEVNLLRAKYKADLVCLVSEAGGGGVAYLGGGKSFGFSVIARHTIMKSGWTLGHELGHNFGCPHKRGYAFKAEGTGYYTVMSMGPGQRGLLRYSNPDVNYKGTPMGTVANNNAATIKRNAKRIARYY